ncbi:MAG TPA: hypothetical protein VE842_00200, partial [Pyrinomonadaceae bacterium]|nr:hypothetical protein [Pyrinomonadaceae bacterium]
MKSALTILLLVTLCVGSFAQSAPRSTSGAALPPGYWPLDKSGPIIARTQTIRLSPDLSHLGRGERAAVGKLLEAGVIFQDIYEEQRHAQALSSRRNL